MCYVYDIVLNFNNYLYEFYEWKKEDSLTHIKRINLIRVDSVTYNNVYDNIVTFNNELLLSIFNKCEYYTNRTIETIPYAFLLTDSYRVMGILLDNNGKTIKYSSLLLDEEEDILDVSSKLAEVKLDYKKLMKREKNEFKTRQEINIINYIKKDLDTDYKNNDINKLKYLYYEYFNKQNDDIDVIYHELLEELSKDINEKHYDLYNLIKLSLCQKTS